MIMHVGRGVLVSVAILLSSTAAGAVDPTPSRGPRPEWVTTLAIPDPDPSRKEEPAQFLLMASQSRFAKSALDIFFEYAIVPQTIAGLQGAGTIILPWNVSQSDLVVNQVELRRGTQVIDLLKDAEFTVLRRENNLEYAKLDGLRTVVLPAKGLKLGDVVHVSATYHVKADSVGTQLDNQIQWKPPARIGLFQARVLVEPGLEVKWRAAPLVDKPSITTTPAGTVYLFEKRNAEPPKFPNAMLAADRALDVQFTRIGSWGQIASTFQPLFDEARRIQPDSDLAKQADHIAGENKDPASRMMAALRLAQEQVRYVALLLGDGAYAPTPAEDNWDSKFGDCKGKAAMLLAMLDRMGIAAVPLLVKSEDGELLGQRLPSIDSFDHVIVRATIDGKNYYLDPTDYGQRTVAEVSGSGLGYGLPLVAGANLEKLPMVPVDQPIRESSLTWDASKGIVGDIPFTARVTLRSTAATQARVKRATAEDKAKLEELLKDYMPGIENDDLQIVDWVEADQSGNFVINYKGTTALPWDRYDGKKGYRASFSNDAAQWEPKFDRDEGAFKDRDVLIGENYWQKEIETIILPNGGKGFSLDATPISETVAGTKFNRTVVLEGGKATSTGEFHHVAWAIPAAEARKAVPRLEELHEDYAYLVAPRGFKPAKDKSKD